MLQSVWTTFLTEKTLFIKLLIEHIEISMIAILIAIIIGGIAGILISEFEKSAKITLGVINFLYTIPSISMLGFLIPFSGVGNATAVIALTIYALLPMVRSTHTGIKQVDPLLLEAAEGMGSTRWQILYKITGNASDLIRNPKHGCYDDCTRRYRFLHWSRRTWSGDLPWNHDKQHSDDDGRKSFNRSVSFGYGSFSWNC